MIRLVRSADRCATAWRRPPAANTTTNTAPSRRQVLGRLLLLGPCTLAACATRPVAPLVLPASSQAFSGRLAIRVDASPQGGAQSITALFELKGQPEVGQLALSTPLGSMLARAEWTADAVRLDTPQGQRQFTDLASLGREALGQDLPVAALFDWLQGRPWPGASHRPAEATASGFEQLGWQVDTRQLGEGQLRAQRPASGSGGAVTVRVLLDRS